MKRTVTFTVGDMNTRLSICPVCSTPAPLLGTTCSKCGANLFEVPSQQNAHPAGAPSPESAAPASTSAPASASVPDANELQVDKEMQQEEASVDTADAAAAAPIMTGNTPAPSSDAVPSEATEIEPSSGETEPAGSNNAQDASTLDPDRVADPDSMLLAPQDENDNEVFAPAEDPIAPPELQPEDDTTPYASASATWGVPDSADGETGSTGEVQAPADPVSPSSPAPAQWGVRDNMASGVADSEQVETPPAPASSPTEEDPPLPPGFPSTQDSEEATWNEGSNSERDYVLTHPALSHEPPPLEKPDSEPFSTSEEFHEPDPLAKSETVPIRAKQVSDVTVMLIAIVVIIILVAVAAVVTHVVKL